MALRQVPRREYDPPQSDMEYGHYIHQPGALFRVLGGSDLIKFLFGIFRVLLS